MKQLIAILILSTLFAVAVNGFLFSKKFVDGCDPDPCKHKAKCSLNPKNKTDFSCNCSTGYYGKTCDKKDGCYSQPCKKGKCILDKKDPGNFTCACEIGYVGNKCDTSDACLKNPCKSGSKCSLDAKLKAVCSCPEGFGGKNCDKKVCNITQFKSKSFTKTSPKVYVDQAIEKNLTRVEELAHLCKVKIHVLKSFILNPDLKTANTYDFKDKINANFYIGQAIGFHVYDLDDKLLCNEICLGKIPVPQEGARCFTEGLHAIGMKWSFTDPTTFSTGFHIGNLTRYNSLRTSHQVGCRDTKFS